jgi:predicted transposase/invertase (TIGR01784 family)
LFADENNFVFLRMPKTKIPKATKLVSFDFAIKYLLRNKSNFVIIEGFLSELLKREVKIKQFLESESNRISLDDKSNRVDILAELDGEELVIIEIQNKDELDYFYRMLFATSKLLTEYMYKGDVYSKVKKIFSVNIIYFELGQGKDYIYHGKTQFEGIHLKDVLQLSENQKQTFTKKHVYELYPEYYLLMVNKFDEATKNGLDEWIYFLKTDEVLNNFKAKGLKEAKKELDILKLPEKDRKEYEKHIDELRFRASVLMTEQIKLEFAEKKAKEKGLKEGLKKGIEKGIKKGIKEGIKEGKKQGIEEGKKQGIEEGKKEEKTKIARNMLELGVDVKIISKTTGLSEEEIQKL